MPQQPSIASPPGQGLPPRFPLKITRDPDQSHAAILRDMLALHPECPS